MISSPSPCSAYTSTVLPASGSPRQRGSGKTRGWFSVSVDSDKNFTIRGDGSKIIKDTKEGGEILGDKIKNGVDNLKKDENGTPSPTGGTVDGDRANGTTAEGGGTYAPDGTADVHASVVNGNRGNGGVPGECGGIHAPHTVPTLPGSTVTGNKAATDSDDLFVGP